MDARTTARRDVAATSRRLAEAGLLIGTAGNVSLLFDGPTGPEVAITATGTELANLTTDQVSVVDLEGTHLMGQLAVTAEAELHLLLLRERGGAVVHTHSPIATAVSLVADEIPCVHYQQLLLGGAIRVAPFAVFGSAELAESVHAGMQDRHAAILANHGTVTAGSDLAQAASHAELLEWVADLYWRARAIGEPRALTAEQQGAVITAALSTGYGTTRQAGA